MGDSAAAGTSAMTDASPRCSCTIYPLLFGAQTLKVTLVPLRWWWWWGRRGEAGGWTTLFSHPADIGVGGALWWAQVVKLPSYGNVLPNPKGSGTAGWSRQFFNKKISAWILLTNLPVTSPPLSPMPFCMRRRFPDNRPRRISSSMQNAKCKILRRHLPEWDCPCSSMFGPATDYEWSKR